MIRNVYLTLALLLFTGLGAFAQSGSIKGKIYDKATKEPLAFASVVAEINGAQLGGAQSDFDGQFSIKPLQPGKYSLKISYVGYNDLIITDVLVSIDKITFQDLVLSKKVIETKTVEIVSYKVPLIEKGNTQTGATITREEIQAAPTRDVKSVVAQAAGVTQKDEGDAVNIRGGRSASTDYYIDGIRVRGSERLPQSGVEQVTAIVGGTPAQYGDATSGIISITTRGPSQKFEGGVEYVTSELFDKYGYNLVSANLSGPIFKKKIEGGGEKAMLGFFISGELQSDKDADPSSIGVYKLKASKLDELKANPIIPYTTGPNSYGYHFAEEYYHANDFEQSKTKNNQKAKSYRLNGKIDFQPLDNTTITLGGSYNRDKNRGGYNFDRELYNFDENPEAITTDYRVFARLTQRIASTYKSEKDANASLFRNVFFSIQAEYGKNLVTNQDPIHKKDFWSYGYFGKFHNERKLFHQPDSLDANSNLFTHNDYTNNYDYSSVGANPTSEQYNNIAYDFYKANSGLTTFNSINVLSGIGGIPNGFVDLFRPLNVMGEWEAIGSARNVYATTDNDNYRITIGGSTDIKNHSIKVGFEFEQRIDRSYQNRPRGLYQTGRSYANKNYVSADRSNLLNRDTIVNPVTGAIEIYSNFGSGYAPDSVEGVAVEGFYENVRKQNATSNTQYLDFDALSPDKLDIKMFSPDQLLQSNLVDFYFGYDIYGNKTNDKSSFVDFFTQKSNGNYTRSIGAFRPTYIAGYIQDQFAIDNLNFNIGLRIDRFDANQKSIKDKYLFLDSYNVGDFPGGIPNRPDNIKDNYIPYLGVAGDLTTVVGYRNGSTWYDLNGGIVSDPDLIATTSSTGKIYPLVKPDAGTVADKNWNIAGVFEDYKPQISIMPRIAFAFSITDEAQFFAHYDVLTQRPSSNLRNDPIDIYNYQRSGSGDINNSSLKPERTTDYELGFKQVLSKSSALTISAFYREMKNMIQIANVKNAAPYTYRSWDNIDFGTVKGFSFSYDLRRTGNVRLTANYTLQFAQGTGSGSNSNVELTNTAQPNLRLILPLDFDQRHTFSVSMDYRYGEGSNYNGPLIGGKPILESFGVNAVFKANSGTPYTRQSRATQEGAAIGWQSNGQRAVQGTVNGARNPWQFRIDLKIDKDIAIKISDKKKANINVYLQIQNVLDTRNIVNVYRATGNATDDGFIKSPDGQQLSATQTDSQAFIDQYYIKLQNPDNYSLPRRSRIGVRFDF